MLIDHNIITPKLIVHIKNLSERVFEGLTDLTIDKTAVDIINIFNNKINEPQFSEIHKVIGSGFRVKIFDENDKDDLITEVSRLNWQTSYKLFKEVFSTQSRY